MTDQLTKPAPAPWDWEATGFATTNGACHLYIVDANGRKIAAVWGKGGEKEATAILLAAAPDLLAACIALSKRMPKRGEVYRSGIGGSGALTHYDPEVEDMFAAIDKATGTPVRATDSEIKEELRNEIQASGDC